MRRELECIAVVASGRRVTLFEVEEKVDGEWMNVPQMAILCDDEARIAFVSRRVASENFRFGAFSLTNSYRVREVKALRGVMVSSSLITDFGDGIRMRTVVEIELDPDTKGTYR
jgi:hypothetical protein